MGQPDNDGDESIERRLDWLERRVQQLDPFWKKVEDELELTYDKDADEITGAIGKYTFIDFVEFLFDNNYMTKDNLPYEPEKLRRGNRYLLNTEPEHKDGTPMRDKHEVQDGIFLETNHQPSRMRRYAKELGNRFGKGDFDYTPV